MMIRATPGRISAVLFLSLAGTMLFPACVIKIETGTAGENADGEMDGSPITNNNADPETPAYTPTPEEEQAIKDAQSVDPQVRALASAKAGFAAYALTGLMEEQILTNGIDPASIDENALIQMINDMAPLAWDAASAWIGSLDPEVLQTPGYPIKVECMDPPMYCQPSVKCDFAKTCVLDDCGDPKSGKCKPCPDQWNLGNLVTDGWCSYLCYSGKDVVGVAVTFRPRIGKNIIPWVKTCWSNP